MSSGARGPEPSPSSPTVRLSGLCVRAGGRILLEQAEAEFPAGRISLLVGGSGTGKSVLLNLIAGLAGRGSPGLEVEGSIRIGEVERLGRRREGAGANVGIVFQSFALFDELSAAANVRFGHDHASGRGAGGDEVARGLLDALGVPKGVPVGLLSGGQKQRLAIARTLAFDPSVLVYDEPTSGLDPANARRVAERIREAQARHGKTTIVVTHDYESLAGIAEAVFWLDHHQRRIVPLTAGTELAALAERLGRPQAAPPEPAIARPALAARLGAGAAGLFAATADAALATLRSLERLLPRWRSPRWGLRFLLHYFWLLASPSSLAYFSAAGLIAALVATHFTFKFLPFKAYTEPLITEELLQGLGFSLYRIIVPVLLTVLFAARGGAALAADVGSRAYSRQTDALRSFGAEPAAYLLTNILWASLLALPLLTLLGFGVARLTSLVVFLYGHPEHNPLFWDAHFHRGLRASGEWLYLGTGWTLAKVLLCAFGVAAVSFHQGLRPKLSAPEVSRGITRSIIWGTLHVLLVHFAFAFIEFED